MNTRSILTHASHVIGLLLAAYLLLCVYMFFTQRDQLYFPADGMDAPLAYGLAMRELTLDSGDGPSVRAWYAPPAGNRPVLVFFHGNAGHLGYRAGKFQAFMEAGYGVMAPSYRGFGDSEGSPSEEGIYKDCRAAIRYLMNQGIGQERMVFYGESLGTGVASRMATEFDGRALVLEAPYTSMVDRGQEVFWYLPVGLLLRDRFDNLDSQAAIDEPLLVLHGARDRVIPIEHGREVYEAASHPKRFMAFPENRHNNIAAPRLEAAVSSFLDGLRDGG